MFDVLSKIEIDGHEFERVRDRDTGCEAIRKRYDNRAGQTSRCCPTVWIDDVNSFVKGAMALTNANEVPIFDAVKKVSKEIEIRAQFESECG